LAAIEAAASMVESSAYTTSTDGNPRLDPAAAHLAGQDQHHITIANAIRALLAKHNLNDGERK
jgi:hypothetical protein